MRKILRRQTGLTDLTKKLENKSKIKRNKKQIKPEVKPEVINKTKFLSKSESEKCLSRDTVKSHVTSGLSRKRKSFGDEP